MQQNNVPVYQNNDFTPTRITGASPVKRIENPVVGWGRYIGRRIVFGLSNIFSQGSQQGYGLCRGQGCKRGGRGFRGGQGGQGRNR